ncbi:MAG: hypothetical protein WDN72_01695 [Alphaproteobacteria bacterium]
MEQSGFSSFLRGFGSGAFNSALMLGIFTGVGYLVTGGLLMSLPMAGIMIGSIGLFNGVMGVWRHHEEQNNAKLIARDILRDSQIRSASLGVAPSLSQQADLAEPAQSAGRGSWAERAGSSAGGDRIQSILDNGAMSAKDRASAILAERESGASASRS